MAALLSLLLGVLFGLGLIVSGMNNPAKVLAFLDIGGTWDPSLALVMASACGIAGILFAYADKRGRSWLGSVALPLERGLPDRRLVLGSLLFGIGWGLSGFCPGPALVGIAAGFSDAVVFGVAMLIGMAAHDRLTRVTSQYK
jgi:hypothetical protein